MRTGEGKAHGLEGLEVQRLVGGVGQAPQAQQLQALPLQATPAGEEGRGPGEQAGGPV